MPLTTYSNYLENNVELIVVFPEFFAMSGFFTNTKMIDREMDGKDRLIHIGILDCFASGKQRHYEHARKSVLRKPILLYDSRHYHKQESILILRIRGFQIDGESFYYENPPKPSFTNWVPLEV